jgi:hypothetical protein
MVSAIIKKISLLNISKPQGFNRDYAASLAPQSRNAFGETSLRVAPSQASFFAAKLFISKNLHLKMIACQPDSQVVIFPKIWAYLPLRKW